MKHVHLIFYCAICTVLATSCVSKKKYNELLTRKLSLEADKSACDDTVASLRSYKLKLLNDSLNLAEALSKTERSLTDEETISQKLREDLKKLNDKNATDNSKLSASLLAKEKQLMELDNNLQLSKKQNEQLSANLAEREKKVQELQKILDEQVRKVNELKNKVAGALLNFKDNDLTVQIKNGKVYVSLAEQLLFKSGSITVDKKGVEALKKLAHVLKEQADVNIMVEGHTDDVPLIKGSQGMADNWDLSVLRATSIVRILTDEGVQPGKVTPSGKGPFLPIATGKTPEARQKNRRTEIIITPKLDELFQLLDNH